MRTRLALGGVAVALLAGLVVPASATPPDEPVPAPAPRATVGHPDGTGRVALPRALRGDERVSALVQLDGAPVSVQTRTTGVGTALAARRVARVQADVVPRLEAAGARVYGRLGTVLNAVQVRARVADLEALAEVPGVRKVQVSRVVRLANARSDQATGADEAWERLGLTGKGQVIGIIDTGVDYTHAGFGGPGTRAAYTQNDRTRVETGTFPTAKVIGGYDFVGEAYDASSTSETAAIPRPDKDPLDCDGHGSHVAGTAAGLGVTLAGRTYTGPYTEASLKSRFAVAPGAAPQAKIRAYRVFGCSGSASDDVIVAAIDRAVRDRVQVLNLSFASSFGTSHDLETEAVDAATAAGVLVVAAAGNEGRNAYVTGSPATATTAVAVAAVDATAPTTPATTATFSSGGPRRLGSAQKPDLAAPGRDIASVAQGTGNGATLMSGTSMATPHTAGLAALVRQAHPTWSAYRVKAALLSTASATAVSGYDSRRLGTGLVQARRAASTKTWASTSGGLDSLRFGLNQLSGAYSEKQTFTLTNRSSTSVRYQLSPVFSSSRRGSTLTLSPSAVTVKPGTSATVSATLALSRAAVAALPGASSSDHGALSSVHGVVVAKPTTATAAHPSLRIAFLSVPVPLSAVTATPSVSAGATGDPGAITLTNRGPHAGTASLFQRLLSDPAGDATTAETADVTELGVQALTAPGGDPADRMLVFAVGEAKGTSTHSTEEVDLSLDVDGDGRTDYYLFSADTGLITSGEPDGTLTAFTVTPGGDLVDQRTASAPANGSTTLLRVLASTIGVTATSPAVRVGATGYSALDLGVDDVGGTGRFQPFAPALAAAPRVTVPAGGSVTVPTRITRSRLASQTSTGWLVVTPDDAAGAEADRVDLRLAAPTAALSTGGTGVRPTATR